MTRPTDPAFARPKTTAGEYEGGSEAQEGMTKREYFAACALPGVLAADPAGDLTPEHAARIAVRHADALIHALNGEGGNA